MTQTLLQRIERATLSLQLSQRAEMDEAQLLRAADLIAALFLYAVDGRSAPQRVARVLAITPRGRAGLAAQCAPAARPGRQAGPA